jgi:hypothetical protein
MHLLATLPRDRRDARDTALIDLRMASEHAQVELRDVVAAVVRRELHASEGHPGRPAVWMVRTCDVDDWATRRRPKRGLRLIRAS